MFAGLHYWTYSAILSKQKIYDWFASSWKAITTIIVIKSFLYAGISNHIDGSEDIICKYLLLLHGKKSEDVIHDAKRFFADPYANAENTFDLNQNDNLK